MPVGTSNPDQPYYEDGYAQAVDAHQTSARAEGRPVVYITKPDVEDRSNLSLVGSMAAGVTSDSLAQKYQDLRKYGLGMSGIDRGNAINADENQVEETPLSKELGSSSIRMPPGGPTEPAGALKPEGGTQTPGKVSGQELPNIEDVPHHDWIESAAKGMFEAFKTPGEVAQGKIDMNTPEGLRKANELAMTMVGAPSAIVEKAGAGTLGSFAGIRGKTVDRTALGHANILEGNAEHPDQILKKTGFFRGADGRWRYEIDDSKASFDRKWADVEEGVKNPPLLTTKLSKILDHPELYKAYPELKDVKVTHNFMADSSFWDRSSNEIVMASQHIKNQGVLMHEIQHAIQDIEGFAKGGSPGVAGEDFMLKYAPAMRNLEPEMARLVDKKDSGIALTKAEEARAAWLTKVAKKYLEYNKAGNEEAMRYYLRLTGETEARNVDTRLLMTEAERRKLHPMHTEDVAAPHQISVDEAVSTSAYGVTDPKTGRLMKSVEPTNFRRAANDNLPVNHPDRPYNDRDPSMIGSRENDEAMDTAWKKMVERSNKIDDVNKRIDTLMKKYPHSDIDKARLKKLRQERLDIWK